MYQYKENAPHYNCVSPAYLYGREVPELPFAHPDTRDEDETYLRLSLPRVLGVLRTLKTRKSVSRVQGSVDVTIDSTPDQSSPEFFQGFAHFDQRKQGDYTNMRFIARDVDRLLTHPKSFIIGFFSRKMDEATETVVKKVWDLDDRLVAALGRFSCILGYVTCEKPDGQWFNYVFLEDDKAVDKWRNFQMHGAAVTISPAYYDWVRINHAVLPCSLESLLDIPGGEKKLQIIRTKYFLYRKHKCVWRAIRKYKTDEWFHSLPEHQPIKPYVFASFLGDENLAFHKQIAEHIGRKTGLPVKFIDIDELTMDGAEPRPSDFSSIQKYNVDFAFTSASTYTTSFPNLVALAAPVVNTANSGPDEAAGGSNINIEASLVASAWVHTKVQQLVRKTITDIHTHKEHAQLLQEKAFVRFTEVVYEDYEM